MSPSPQLTADCHLPPVSVQVQGGSGSALLSGQMTTVTRDTALSLASGPLRLTIAGDGRWAVRSVSAPTSSSQNGVVAAGPPSTVFWQGPAVLGLTPDAGRTMDVTICTP
ncbi:MAG: hypothetical protein R2712_13180 [Vicinamibacterales bacterium]